MPEFTHAGSAQNLEPVPPPTARQEAAVALNELRAALKAHGIVLPSLDLDPVTLFASDHGPDRRPLIELGRVNMETVRKLTQALGGAVAG
ncbi:hypothetical protein [Streptomyces litchfieldiae]|uniref:Uncharacterized protein n=1 Tax=Streptomyces litchfieldiae TaxID=3075543 RepID=A0ABU2MZD4_9ACTN|nr:hypothetical protein [Streptomyces sp. DSM 44938]MDT0347021.1 hypothetical protein [Streptomyces sp. DSM 44938]